MTENLEKSLDDQHGADFEAICDNLSELMAGGETQHQHGEEGEEGSIYLSALEYLSDTNCVATGSFVLGGVEYAFMVDAGISNGFKFSYLSADGPIPEIN